MSVPSQGGSYPKSTRGTWVTEHMDVAGESSDHSRLVVSNGLCKAQGSRTSEKPYIPIYMSRPTRKNQNHLLPSDGRGDESGRVGGRVEDLGPTLVPQSVLQSESAQVDGTNEHQHQYVSSLNNGKWRGSHM